jgi:hypothetical protein
MACILAATFDRGARVCLRLRYSVRPLLHAGCHCARSLAGSVSRYFGHLPNHSGGGGTICSAAVPGEVRCPQPSVAQARLPHAFDPGVHSQHPLPAAQDRRAVGGRDLSQARIQHYSGERRSSSPCLRVIQPTELSRPVLSLASRYPARHISAASLRETTMAQRSLLLSRPTLVSIPGSCCSEFLGVVFCSCELPSRRLTESWRRSPSTLSRTSTGAPTGLGGSRKVRGLIVCDW